MHGHTHLNQPPKAKPIPPRETNELGGVMARFANDQAIKNYCGSKGFVSWDVTSIGMVFGCRKDKTEALIGWVQ